MKTIVFRCRYDVAVHEVEEEVLFDNDVTEEEIAKEYEEWIWFRVGDQFT
ncbi:MULTISPECIES: hypothetical protein [Bacillus cereus group]|uniref:Uncharacterized protein n=1 Tax=Bacillus proteolyticus TaxID=2026192 RepID=A0ABV3IHV8_9BACI|nr:hypothetical protein [Bacillus cereus group sp. N8]MBJ8107926.1 hypothetical protein [Bacillus cereus group sp. N8]